MTTGIANSNLALLVRDAVSVLVELVNKDVQISSYMTLSLVYDDVLRSVF